MTGTKNRGAGRRLARIAIAGALVMGAVQSASADDAGIHDFFSSIFGGGQAQPAPVYAPAPAYAPGPADEARQHRSSRPRPLTVRLHRPKPRIVYAEAPTKPAPVSIYEDRTLRRGDAVMTAKGVRIFAGSSSWPYSDGDFVALRDAGPVNKDMSKVLAQLDKLPRG